MNKEEKLRKQEQPLFKTNRFFSLAEEYRIYGTSDVEIALIDMTDEFWKEIEIEIRDEELVDIQLNAKVRMSKSSTGIYIGKRLFELMIKHKKREGGKFGINNIARDQQEYSRIMRNPLSRNTVIVTDEMNELEQTGENVTIEKALNNVFSNVQAGRYVHRVCCSPRETIDVNADVFLEVISVDRRKKITHCYLYYNVFKGGQTYKQLLGHVNFYLGDLIKNWLKIKNLFNKENKTESDKNKIEEMRKKDFYVEYMIRKYEKMELITKEGILRPRLLEYANVILNVEEKLRELAKLNVLVKDTVKNYIKMYCRKGGIPTSIIGEELMTQEVIGILSLWKNLNKINKDIKRLIEKENFGKEDKEKVQIMKDISIELLNTIHAQLEELRRYREINEKYQIVKSEVTN